MKCESLTLVEELEFLRSKVTNWVKQVLQRRLGLGRLHGVSGVMPKLVAEGVLIC